MRKGIGRNDLCPCGSGKKYKKYCLDNADQDTTSEFQSKYRFEAGSYGDVGSFMPVWSKNSSLLRYQHITTDSRCHNLFVLYLNGGVQSADY